MKQFAIQKNYARKKTSLYIYLFSLFGEMCYCKRTMHQRKNRSSCVSTPIQELSAFIEFFRYLFTLLTLTSHFSDAEGYSSIQGVPRTRVTKIN